MSRLRRYMVKGRLEAGCDEAGRGCLAGPVFAAAVILPAGIRLPKLNDSKKLTAEQRSDLRIRIERGATAWAVAQVEPKEIDRINILNASFKAMHLAIDRLDPKPDWLLIDGNRFHPYPGIPADCIVQGDGKFAVIAAASILAKTYRDDYMRSLHRDFPDYDWEHNMGYPTLSHREGIRQAGPTEHHRNSFRLLPDQQLNLFEDAL